MSKRKSNFGVRKVQGGYAVFHKWTRRNVEIFRGENSRDRARAKKAELEAKHAEA